MTRWVTFVIVAAFIAVLLCLWPLWAMLGALAWGLFGSF